jgi:hypoxanthine phosphoribosyltransferase
MNDESFDCELVSWEEAYELSRDLAAIIKSTGYKPDILIAIGRGGFVPARIVSDFMLHCMLTSIKIEHYDIAASMHDETIIRFPLSVDVKDMLVLLLDDVTDTGDTLRTAVDYLNGFGPKEIKTGVLQHKVRSKFVPDFYAEKIVEWKWIIYPWAAHEDLVGFTKRVLSREPLSGDEICDEMKRRYKLDIDAARMDNLLEELIAIGAAERKESKYKLQDNF